MRDFFLLFFSLSSAWATEPAGFFSQRVLRFSLQFTESYECNGTLLSRKLLLTAKHCLTMEDRLQYVEFFENVRVKGEDVVAFVHPTLDIALLRVPLVHKTEGVVSPVQIGADLEQASADQLANAFIVSKVPQSHSFGSSRQQKLMEKPCPLLGMADPVHWKGDCLAQAGLSGSLVAIPSQGGAKIVGVLRGFFYRWPEIAAIHGIDELTVNVTEQLMAADNVVSGEITQGDSVAPFLSRILTP